MDLDLVLRIEKPPSPTNSNSSKEKKFYEKWKISNCMSLMIIKRSIPETLRVWYSKRLPMPNNSLPRLKIIFKSNKAK